MKFITIAEKEANQFLSKNIYDVYINDVEFNKLNSKDANMNKLRHEATNYDFEIERITKLAQKVGYRSSTLNKIAKKVQNKFNNKLTKAIHKANKVVVEAKNAEIAELKAELTARKSNVIQFPVKTKTVSDWTVEYVKSGMTVDKAELLAASKVENAKLRAKGAAAKAARKARLMKAV